MGFNHSDRHRDTQNAGIPAASPVSLYLNPLLAPSIAYYYQEARQQEQQESSLCNGNSLQMMKRRGEAVQESLFFFNKK